MLSSNLLPAALLLAASAASAQAPDFSKVEIKTTKVGGNVYVLEGQGGNMAASIGDDGIALVDDEFAPLSEKIRAALAKLSPQPVRFLINTHWHGDHTGGNANFADTAAILAHENVRKRMVAGAKTRFGDVPPAAPKALPVLTFDESVTLHWNGEDVRVVHQRPGHTDGDSVVWFTKSNVVHLGDDYFSDAFPFFDSASGGSIRGVIAVIDSVMPQLPKDVKVIPGHGPVTSAEEVRKWARTLEEIVNTVEKAKQSGKTVAQMQQEKILAPWAPWGKGFISADMFIQLVDAELSASAKK